MEFPGERRTESWKSPQSLNWSGLLGVTKKYIVLTASYFTAFELQESLKGSRQDG